MKAYKGSTMRRVRCKSGQMGMRQRLQARYEFNYDAWESYSNMYGLAQRLGGETKELWDKNPIVDSSVNPSDFCIAP